MAALEQFFVAFEHVTHPILPIGRGMLGDRFHEDAFLGSHREA